jgi:putative endopeptidase
MSMKRTGLLALTVFSSLTYFGCMNNQTKTPSGGLDLSWMDTTANPRNDFYEYACGGWMKTHEIPASDPRYGTFYALRDKSLDDLHWVVDSASKITDAPKGSVTQQVSDFYAAAMDSVTANQNGINPLKPYIMKIDTVRNPESMMLLAAEEQMQGASPIFGFSVFSDQKISNKMAAYITQGGLGLPDRDYYFRKDPRSAGYRAAYMTHVANIFKLIGEDSNKAKSDAKAVYAIEEKFAAASLTNVQERDPYLTYNKMSVAQLNKLTPSVNWNAILAASDVKTDTIITDNPKFFSNLETMFHSVSMADWKSYLRWQYVHSFASYLSDNFVQENFSFYGKTLNGQKELRPRWKRGVQNTDGELGEALGQLYVTKFFPASSKDKMLDLVNNLLASYKERISAADWMADSTRNKALQKLDVLTKKIGYPDKWRDFSGLQIDRSSYVLNVIRANIFNNLFLINQLGKPVDRSQWGMTPPTVNAYYNPSWNEIVFPAGILQPPFFDPNADDAVNYGRIGAVIGHEMTHGYDDQGSQYDAEGNLKNWWSKKDSIEYHKRIQRIINQFNNYTVLDTVHINGELTLGENTADLGGLTIAYQAFKKTDEGKDTTLRIQGFTPDQRFFIAFAQVWASKDRPDALIQQVYTNPHSPGMLRAIGAPSNLVAFYNAFGVKPGDKMYRPDSIRAKIW